MVIPSSKEWRSIFIQARDIASQLDQEMSTVHVLLSIFLIPNKAEQLLLDRDIDEDRVLEQIDELGEEPASALEQVAIRSQQAAARCDSPEIGSLHLLIGLTRVREGQAYQLLKKCGVELSKLRNQAMSYLTGRVKRRFKSQVEEVQVPALVAPPESHPTQHDTLDWLTAGPVEEAEPEVPAGPGALDAKEYPWLSRLGRNLTQLALCGELDPLIGRDRELDEIIDILNKRRANNPCLVGEPGVGKTALVEGLAVMLAYHQIPGLSGKILIELDMGSLLAGTQLRGSLAEKLKGIKEEVKKAQGQIIVFIDEVHTLVRAGATGESAQDASNDLKTALGRGQFPCIGATTIKDFKSYIEPDPALVRRFQLIWVEEPTEEEAHLVVEGVVPHYGAYHQVRYLPEALRAAVRLSARFIHDRKLPAKAIDIIDLAGSRARRSGLNEVGVEHVAQAIAYMASVPEEHLFVEESKRLLTMEDSLAEQIIGHRGQVRQIAMVLRRNYAGFNGNRPLGSFLFLGPPGVGKTETAKALAVYMFGSSRAILRLDMSEFQDSASVNRLIGAPPGFVGHDDGGQLTEAIRTKPYQLILIDEIEKAHRDVSMLLLQLLDEGVLTDGKGRRVSFSQTVVVMTSNLGSEAYTAKGRGPIGFSQGPESQEQIRERILDSAQRHFAPELWNRMDEQLVFAPLSQEELRSIATLLIEKSCLRLEKERSIRYAVREEVLDWLIERGGFHPRRGARPMRAMIERYLEASLADLILQGIVQPGTYWEAYLDAEGQLNWKNLPQPKVDSAPPAFHAQTTPAESAPYPGTDLDENEEDDDPLDPIAVPLHSSN
ncbi:MAG: ATP-dependent Clp protease ATP-binding subunit [Deltaproteobacteria bacterium]|nr:MAG: ATP-dependent Clp protease ATP-binding subunit [Deltaproteobacteria bacterium]